MNLWCPLLSSLTSKRHIISVFDDELTRFPVTESPFWSSMVTLMRAPRTRVGRIKHSSKRPLSIYDPMYGPERRIGKRLDLPSKKEMEKFPTS